MFFPCMGEYRRIIDASWHSEHVNFDPFPSAPPGRLLGRSGWLDYAGVVCIFRRQRLLNWRKMPVVEDNWIGTPLKIIRTLFGKFMQLLN